MTPPRFPRDAFDDHVVAAIAAILPERWDPSGRIIAAAARRRDKSGTLRTYHDYALVLAGMAASGASQAAILGFLRSEEEALLGSAITTGRERGSVAMGVWAAVGREPKRSRSDTGGADAE